MEELLRIFREPKMILDCFDHLLGWVYAFFLIAQALWLIAVAKKPGPNRWTRMYELVGIPLVAALLNWRLGEDSTVQIGYCAVWGYTIMLLATLFVRLYSCQKQKSMAKGQKAEKHCP